MLKKGNFPSYVSLLSPSPEAFPFIQAWQFRKAKLKVLNTSMAREKQEGLPMGQVSRPSSSLSGRSPSAPDGERAVAVTPASPGGKGPGRFPSALPHRASPSSLILEHAAVGQGRARAAAKSSQGQGKGAAGPVAPSGPWHLSAVCPDDLNLYLQAYRCTIKYIPQHFLYLFDICSVSYVVPSSYCPTLSLLGYISPFPTGSPLQKNQTIKRPIITWDLKLK